MRCSGRWGGGTAAMMWLRLSVQSVQDFPLHGSQPISSAGFLVRQMKTLQRRSISSGWLSLRRSISPGTRTGREHRLPAGLICRIGSRKTDPGWLPWLPGRSSIKFIPDSSEKSWMCSSPKLYRKVQSPHGIPHTGRWSSVRTYRSEPDAVCGSPAIAAITWWERESADLRLPHIPPTFGILRTDQNEGDKRLHRTDERATDHIPVVPHRIEFYAPADNKGRSPEASLHSHSPELFTHTEFGQIDINQSGRVLPNRNFYSPKTKIQIWSSGKKMRCRHGRQSTWNTSLNLEDA